MKEAVATAHRADSWQTLADYLALTKRA